MSSTEKAGMGCLALSGGGIILVSILIGLKIIPWSGPLWDTQVIWLGFLVLISSFIGLVGWAIKQRPLGSLIDERNKMSLSRLQIIIWTVVILSGWMTAVLWNIAQTSTTDPLGIRLPEQIWALLGISTVSVVLQPIILDAKKRQPTNAQALLENRSVAGANPNTNAKGNLATNSTPQEAQIYDLFKGDEAGNFPYLDIGKVQMFLFTLMIVLAYAAALAAKFGTLKVGTAITDFPPVSDSMVALLAISHAGYLGYKAAPHTTTDSGTTNLVMAGALTGRGTLDRAAATPTFQFTVRGFMAAEEVVIWLRKPDASEMALPEATANQNGFVTISVDSTNYGAGRYTLYVRGKISWRSMAIPFKVTK